MIRLSCIWFSEARISDIDTYWNIIEIGKIPNLLFVSVWNTGNLELISSNVNIKWTFCLDSSADDPLIARDAFRYLIECYPDSGSHLWEFIDYILS